MSSAEVEKLSIIPVIKACLISAQDGITISNLNDDYLQLVGNEIPYRKLGYQSLVDFLKSLPDVSIQSRGSVNFVHLNVSGNSAVLSNLVKGQKKSAPKRKKGTNKNIIHIKQNRPPRYHRRPSVPSAPPRPIMKVNVPQNGQTRTVSFMNDDMTDENRNLKLIGEKPFQNSLQLEPLLPANYRPAKSNVAPAGNKTIPYKHSVSLDNTLPKANSLTNRLQKNKSSPVIQNYPLNPPAETVPESKLNNRLKQASNQVKVPVNQKPMPPPLLSSSKSSVPSQPPVRKSAQSRLENIRIPLPESKMVVVVDTQEGNRTSYYQRQLSTYVMENGWPKEPSYVVYKQKSVKRSENEFYACTVRVAIPRQSSELPEEIFQCSTFPNDFLTQVESKENAASLALTHLKEREDLLNAPIENDSHTIIERIKKFIENKESGVWAQKIEDEYKDTYAQLLPKYWLDILKLSDQFEIEELGGSFIIRLKGESSRNIPKISAMPPLIYPAETTWDVFITEALAVTDVYLRFIGDEYSTRLDQFTVLMDKWYTNIGNQCRPKFVVGEYCAVYYGKAWWRVIIKSLNGDSVRIKFIDHGDEEDINRSLLYKLDLQFFKLPPQAISVSLKGLEEFSGRKETKDFFLKTIIGKSLVAVVETFQPPKEISITLYDTSNEEATNLNDSLRHLFELDYKSPLQLEIGTVHEMNVTYIDNDGTVYVQIFNDGLALLQELIDFYEEIDFESLTDYSQVIPDKIYLALQHDDNLYYRVKPLNMAPVDSKVRVSCIDYGNSCDVFLEDMVLMEDSSFLLQQIPGQAIPIYLHEIPSSVFKPSIRDKLQKLVLGDPTPVIVGRVRNFRNGIPVVELFRRTVPDNLLVSINQTLAVEENISLTSAKLKRIQVSHDSKRIQVSHDSVHVSPIMQSLHGGQPVKSKKTTDIIAKILAMYPAGSIERVLLQNQPVLPNIDEYFNVYVHSTASPSHFLINPSNYVESLNKVMDNMNSYYNANKLQPVFEEGSLCAAKDGNIWYRAYIDKVIDLDNVSVKVVDYGCVKIISSSNVKPLVDIFTKHPYIGFSAKVYGILPAHGDWSVEDSITMKNLINKKSVRAKLKDITPNKQGIGGISLSLELYAIDDHGLEFHVGEHFVRQGKAKFD